MPFLSYFVITISLSLSHSIAITRILTPLLYPPTSPPYLTIPSTPIASIQVRGDPHQGSTDEGWNKRLSNECGAILKLIQTKGYDNCNQYRQKNYTKWRDELKNYPKPINTEQDLFTFTQERELPSEKGSSIYNYLLPIVRGERENSIKLEGLQKNPYHLQLTELMGVWGAGPATADKWIHKHNLKSLQEVRIRIYGPPNNLLPCSILPCTRLSLLLSIYIYVYIPLLL